MTRFKKAVTLSLTLHLFPLLILALFLRSGGPFTFDDEHAKNAAQHKQQEKEDIVPKEGEPIDVEVTYVDGVKRIPHDGDQCKDFYGGIGVEYTGLDGNAASKVPSGYPAALAGIKPGDIIIDPPSIMQIRGEPGTEVIVKVQSKDSGEIHTYVLVRDKICVVKDKAQQLNFTK